MKGLVAAAVVFIAPAAMAQAYGRVTIQNYALVKAHVVVTYAACRTDRFVVSQGRKTDKGIVPGVNQAPTSRGACLVHTVSATLDGDTAQVRRYGGAGTSASQFVLGRTFGQVKDAPLWSVFMRSEFDKTFKEYKGASREPWSTYLPPSN